MKDISKIKIQVQIQIKIKMDIKILILIKNLNHYYNKVININKMWIKLIKSSNKF
jgi:hypothetical protein